MSENSWCEAQQQSANEICYQTNPTSQSEQDDNDEQQQNHQQQEQQIYQHHQQQPTPEHNFMKNNFLPQTGHSYPNYFYPQPSLNNNGAGGNNGTTSNPPPPPDHNLHVDKHMEFQDMTNMYDTYNYNQPNKYERYPWPDHHFPQPPPHFGHQRFWQMSKFGRRNIVTPKDSPIKVTLENKTLIERFDKFCTEMIITKTGRRMFPSPQITIHGMEANTKYFILFDVTPADDNRYKFHHFNWVIAGKAEPSPPVRFYIHPESPLTGSQWMKQQITFQKVKLTNNTCDQHGHLILNSMHRYQARIHVVQANDIYQLQFQPFHTYAFPECQFIAVTAYQNSQVTQLKIEHNPFAKGFRKQEKEKREGKKDTEDDTAENVQKFDNDLKRPHSLEAKSGVGPDRKMGCYDMNMNRWNYPDQTDQPSMFGGKPIECCNSQSKYDYRYPQMPHYDPAEKTVQHYVPSSYDHLRYNDISHNMSEQIRPLPYMGDFPSIEYRANAPSFI